MKTSSRIIVIALAAIGAYWNALSHGFVWDDIALVVNNDFIKGLALSKEMMLRSFDYLSGGSSLYYRPLQALSYVFDYSLWGLNPFGFHLTNLILHILAAVLVYCFINALFGNSGVSFLATLLFAVHPLNTSIVNYVSSRADILLLIFSLGALILFMEPSGKYRIFSTLCFILALLSKEVAVILPLVLVLTQEIYFRSHPADRKQCLRARLWYLVFMAASLGYLLFRSKVIKIGVNALPPAGVSPWSILFASVDITLNYLRLFLFPFGLHMLRNIPIVLPAPGNIILYSAVISAFAVSLVIIYRISKRVFLLLAFALLWLLPAVALSFKNPEYYLQARAIMEEHWFCLPLIPLSVIMVLLLKIATLRARNLFYVVAICLFVYFSAITVRENLAWKNNYTLFSHILRYVNNSFTAYRNMGLLYLNKGEKEKAISVYQKALGLRQDDPGRAILCQDIARAYLANNQGAEAEEYCQRAIALRPGYADAHALGGLIYAARKDSAKARQQWKTAIEIDPFNALAFDNLARLSVSDSAIRKYLMERYEGLLQERDFITAYKSRRGLGIIYLYNNMDFYAFLYFKKAFAINPYDHKVNNGLAICFARAGDFKNALRFFRRALRLNPFDPESYRNLAVLYKELNMPKVAESLLGRSALLGVFD